MIGFISNNENQEIIQVFTNSMKKGIPHESEFVTVWKDQYDHDYNHSLMENFFYHFFKAKKVPDDIIDFSNFESSVINHKGQLWIFASNNHAENKPFLYIIDLIKTYNQVWIFDDIEEFREKVVKEAFEFLPENIVCMPNNQVWKMKVEDGKISFSKFKIKPNDNDDEDDKDFSPDPIPSNDLALSS